MRHLFCSTILALGLAAAPASASASQESAELVAALRDADPDIRALAAGLLADEPTDSAADELVARLKDGNESWRVRVAAAKALGSLPSRAGVPALVAAVLDESADWRVRAAAVEALGLRGETALLAGELAQQPQAVTISNGVHAVSLSDPLADARILEALQDEDPRMRSLARSALELGTLLELPATQAASLGEEGPCVARSISVFLASGAGTRGSLTVY